MWFIYINFPPTSLSPFYQLKKVQVCLLNQQKCGAAAVQYILSTRQILVSLFLLTYTLVWPEVKQCDEPMSQQQLAMLMIDAWLSEDFLIIFQMMKTKLCLILLPIMMYTKQFHKRCSNNTKLSELVLLLNILNKHLIYYKRNCMICFVLCIEN